MPLRQTFFHGGRSRARQSFAPQAWGFPTITKEVRFTLTHAQLLAINTTPVALVQGEPGKILLPVWLMMQKPAYSVAYAAAVTFRIKWSDRMVMNSMLGAMSLSLNSLFTDIQASMGTGGVGSQLTYNPTGIGLTIDGAANATGAANPGGCTGTLGYIVLTP